MSESVSLCRNGINRENAVESFASVCELIF